MQCEHGMGRGGGLNQGEERSERRRIVYEAGVAGAESS